MQIIFSTPDEREIVRRLCDDLATKHAPLYKQAHLLLRGALGKQTFTEQIRMAATPFPNGRFASKERGGV